MESTLDFPSDIQKRLLKHLRMCIWGLLKRLRMKLAEPTPGPDGYDFPTAADGVEGMAFIEAAVNSSKNNAAWTKL